MTDEPTMCPNCVTPWKCNGPHLLTDEPTDVHVHTLSDVGTAGERSWDCQYCLDREASLARSDAEVERRCAERDEALHRATFNAELADQRFVETSKVRADLARSEAEVERLKVTGRADYDAAGQFYERAVKAEARVATLREALVYIEDRTATFDCGCELHPLKVCPMHAALDSTDESAGKTAAEAEAEDVQQIREQVAERFAQEDYEAATDESDRSGL